MWWNTHSTTKALAPRVASLLHLVILLLFLYVANELEVLHINKTRCTSALKKGSMAVEE